MSDYSYVFNAHPSFIEEMYLKYQKSPDAVEDGWRSFFQGFEFNEGSNGANGSTTAVGNISKEIGVIAIVFGFRTRGHLLSKTNPIRERRDRKPHLNLQDYGLTEADLDSTFIAGEMIGMKGKTLREIIAKLNDIYCKNIGFEYRHVDNMEKRRWLEKKIEGRSLSADYGVNHEKKKRILEKLNDAVMFEKFLHTKYVGQKRFSLEGGETAIVALDGIINAAADDKVEEVIIGMAHRGRLNVLANIMGKTYEQIFNEFEGTAIPDLSFGDGDVKYHLGYSSQVETLHGKKIHLKLAPNPSHLESVDPVVEGFARAKADILYNSEYDRILPILIHGDAAFAGQGVAYETVQMSQLDGYYTGGTIHFVINNQIGFTTNFDDARSSTYCTASAKTVQAPVFHVNGDDPEAMLFVVELAVEYRQKFNTDVMIDMVCYRKHGHNEGDDPKFTQPEMYSIINNHPNPREIYGAKLFERGDVDKALAESLEKSFWDDLQKRLDKVKQKALPYEYQKPENEWRKLTATNKDKDFESSPDTGISKTQINKILKHLMTLPEGLTPLSKVNRLMKGKQKLLDNNQVDWAFAELLAYGSILMEGKNVRMSGQDVKRGTFSHRHAVFNDAKTYKEYNRFDHLDPKQGKFMIYNSLLSEFAVMGFEYGYSLASPNSLVIWEAQFGDFYNGAQTIIDQYVTAAESKWRRMSGIVLLLPHGYEGQGPEHSSARLERFLQSCAENNMTVANVTSPSNFFHLLKRQLKRNFRKPLIVMSPKSQFRHPLCVSDLSELEKGNGFKEVIVDDIVKARSAKRLILCTGKVYYDLLEYRTANNIKDVAIVRIEQLYPFPKKQVDKILKSYAKSDIKWVQEESQNMGAWTHIMQQYRREPIELISRKATASPATGFKKAHDKQQEKLIKEAFKI